MKKNILLIAVLLTFSSCYYFRVIPEDPYTVRSLKNYEDTGKILILHRGENAWRMYDLDTTENMLHAKLDIQLGYHIKYLDPGEEKLNKFDKPKEPEVINTVHLYTSDTTFNVFDTLVAIPVSSIYSVRSYKYARAASRAATIVPIVVLPVVGFILFAVATFNQSDFDINLD